MDQASRVTSLREELVEELQKLSDLYRRQAEVVGSVEMSYVQEGRRWHGVLERAIHLLASAPQRAGTEGDG